MTLFENINALTQTKKAFNNDDYKDYNPFIINRAFSMAKNTVLLANEMNRPGVLKEENVDFYQNTIPKGKLYFKWIKKRKSDGDIEIIMDYYKVRKEVAISYLDLLSNEDFAKIKEKLITGGLQKTKKK